MLANRQDLTPAQLNRTRQLMNAHVRDSLVAGFESLIPSIDLPDPDDRHVVAAAVHCGASLIVTFNLRDFPAAALQPFQLVAQHPDDFIGELLDQHPASVLEAVARHRRSLKHPPRTVEEYLGTLQAQGLTQSVAMLRRWGVAI